MNKAQSLFVEIGEGGTEREEVEGTDEGNRQEGRLAEEKGDRKCEVSAGGSQTVGRDIQVESQK